ncbi:FAD-binding oxidoreductase [Streptomyces phaeoluteigriseus]|uniref:nitric oxide dioxygenase n=1 Tax=Streptomyces phaeoluteigriseus TaxID=114686 RepID=A0ABY4ZJY2_9ACTN|nr:globin domain-containing protein [Streptomyces phaeoluteigriseus]USQ89332.1 FAD-binding oxidoreductase [Streptomyces phaeoluteigriseus]
MFEARHTMDAPTTRSADNGTSGGGDGWFTPHKQPAPTADGERETADGRRLAALRPVGRKANAPIGEPPPGGAAETGTRIPSPPTAAPEPSADRRTESTVEPPGDLAGAPSTEPRPSFVAERSAAKTPPADHTHAPVETTDSVDARAATPSRTPAGSRTATALPQPGTHRAGAPSQAAGGLQAAPRQSRRPAPPPAPSEPRVPAQRPALAGNPSPDAVLVRRTMAEVAPVADKVTSYFYALLFVRHPHLRPLFPPAMDAQRDRLLKALLTAAEHIDNTPVLVDYLQNLGRGHRKYGTRAEHYPAVGECLIGALSKYAASVWDAETEAAWVRTYTTISQVMIDAAAADELRAPAWWYAEVVSRELRTPDIAVLTLRPDQPYPFRAGQYAGLETPWWPRIWRHYSFASAPRSDGLLTLHVKAVPAGWVSNALVHRAQPGDVVRLGPPAGSMTVDHTRDSGLLCLGGGTGIAPIKALVEDVAEHGARRPVEVFYGARSDHDLYDIDTMLRLQQSHPWLEVRPVVDRHGVLQLPDAIRAFGPWTEYDAYVSGPPGMIRSGVDALRGVGIPAERIRHDSVEELVAAGS